MLLLLLVCIVDNCCTYKTILYVCTVHYKEKITVLSMILPFRQLYYCFLLLFLLLSVLCILYWDLFLMLLNVVAKRLLLWLLLARVVFFCLIFVCLCAKKQKVAVAFKCFGFKGEKNPVFCGTLRKLNFSLHFIFCSLFFFLFFYLEFQLFVYLYLKCL